MKVRYSTNNSGGSFWTNDKHWFALEENGWKVAWFKNRKDWDGEPYKDGRCMGQLAWEAVKEFDCIEDAMDDFARITGLCPEDRGCSCCGPPHNFYDISSWDDETEEEDDD